MSYKKKTVLEDKRYKKVIVFDTETTPVTCDSEKPRLVTGLTYRPVGRQYIQESIEKYIYNGVERWKALKTTTDNQIVFDIGWVLCDKKGNVYKEYNALVEEIFYDMELMKNAYYFKKYKDYLKMLNDGKIKVKPWRDIVRDLEDYIEDFNIKELYAYNIAFDYGALKNTNKLLSKRPLTFFKDNGIKSNCIWGMACQTILQQKSFKKTAIANNWISEKGNIKTSAEIAYRYITSDLEFIESHTALDDSVVESLILAKCFASKKKMSFGTINQPWKLVNNSQ